MLFRTQKNIRYTFGFILLLLVLGIFIYNYTKTPPIKESNKFFSDISFYQTHSKPNEKPQVIFSINWKDEMKKSTVENKDNFIIQQVKLVDREWLPLEGGKSCKINLAQYVYSPWLDTEEKRKNAPPEERNKKITQLFVDISPKEEVNDYYKITVKNIESSSGEKIDSEESGVIQITNFNKFIKM
ncbi:MAG: hypothetical protein U0354_13655 [Candidatus Sericytochromatia bacterium]